MKHTDEEDLIDISDITTENLLAEMHRLTDEVARDSLALNLIWKELVRRYHNGG